jgi:hypothetical protein
MELIKGQTVFVFLCGVDLEFYDKNTPNSYEGIFVGMRENQIMIENDEGNVNCYEPESIFELSEEENEYVIYYIDEHLQESVYYLTSDKLFKEHHEGEQIAKICGVPFEPTDYDKISIFSKEQINIISF